MDRFRLFPILLLLLSCGRLSGQVAGWQQLGPATFPQSASGETNGSGRMCQLKFHPTDSNKLYAVSGSGGLWTSVNGGQTWSVTGTDFLPPITKSASICIDYTNPQILYLGTGDANYLVDCYGIWKSLDGGQTWNPSNNNIGNRLTVEILMSPLGHDTLLAATDDGIWKTYNGGATWVLKCQGAEAFMDMKYKPGSADTIYACSYSRFYRSTDKGETWSYITNGVFIPNNSGQGMKIAVSAASPNTVYLGMIADEGTILKSTDGGSSFVTVYHNTTTQSLTSYYGNPGGANNGAYNLVLAADPVNANILYFGTQKLWKSTDGGVTWSSLYNYGYIVHPDLHDIKFSPFNPGRMYSLNDGGIYTSTNGGAAWSRLSNGLCATEIYGMGQSPLQPDMTCIGTQDNGGLFYNNALWQAFLGGDVFDNWYFDYHTPDRVYSHLGTNYSLVSNTPYTLNLPITTLGDKHYLFTPLSPGTAFLSQQDVWRTKNIYAPTPSWTQLTFTNQDIRSMVLSATDSNELYVLTGNNQILHSLNAMSAAPVFSGITTPVNAPYAGGKLALYKGNSNVLYFTWANKIYRSVNKGAAWTDITGNLPNANIENILVDDYSTNESVYILCGSRVYYRNSASAWLNYSQGLPSLAVILDPNCSMYNDGSVLSYLEVGFFGRGVWRTPLYQPNPLPHPHFGADRTLVCSGQGIHFTDSSLTATAWSWSFPGGNPSTFSGQQPPLIVYNTPGVYPVTLTASNANGSNAETRTAYITVKASVAPPVTEGFEGTFPPPAWETGTGATHVGWNGVPIGGYGASGNSAAFLSNPGTYHDTADLSINCDLSNLSTAKLRFDHAYARTTGNLQSDSLELAVSTDCGSTFSIIYKKGGLALATMPDIPGPLSFNPGPADWRTDSLVLTPYCGQKNVLLRFRGLGQQAEAMCIDNINLTGVANLTVGALVLQDFTIAPNPGTGLFTIGLPTWMKQDIRIRVLNSFGQVVWTYQPAADPTAPIRADLSSLPDGVYYAVFSFGTQSLARKVIVLK